MSCRQRPEYRRLTSSLTRQVEEFEVATSGGFWAAIGDFVNPLQLATFTMLAWQTFGRALDPMATTRRIPTRQSKNFT